MSDTKSELDIIIPGEDSKEESVQLKSDAFTPTNSASEIDKQIRELEYKHESEKGYHQIAERIVNISEDFLKDQHCDKRSLRTWFVKLFSIMLFIQTVFLILLIACSSIKRLPIHVSEHILTAYIVSVFVETLGAVGAMISFSFTSKEESGIVEVLTTVIQNYQKYGNTNKENKKNE